MCCQVTTAVHGLPKKAPFVYSLACNLMCSVRLFAEVREVFARVLSDFGITYTRVPVEPGLHSCHFLPPNLREFYLQVEKDALQSVEVFHRHGIRCVGHSHLY